MSGTFVNENEASTGETTEIVKSLVAFKFELSAACTVKVKTPARRGVPLINPEVERSRPSGNVPPVKPQVYGDTPPVALKTTVYVPDVVPSGSVFDVVIVTPDPT